MIQIMKIMQIMELNYAIACKHNCCATDTEKADYIDYDTDNKDDADDVQINTILFKSLMRTFIYL